jgi:hypothetical protein
VYLFELLANDRAAPVLTVSLDQPAELAADMRRSGLVKDFRARVKPRLAPGGAAAHAAAVALSAPRARV